MVVMRARRARGEGASERRTGGEGEGNCRQDSRYRASEWAVESERTAPRAKGVEASKQASGRCRAVGYAHGVLSDWRLTTDGVRCIHIRTERCEVQQLQNSTAQRKSRETGGGWVVDANP